MKLCLTDRERAVSSRYERESILTPTAGLSPGVDRPRTTADWMMLAERKLRLVKLLLHTPGQRGSCYEACGFAIEAVMKAALLVAHQKPSWDQQMDDLYRTHDLVHLAAALGATPATLLADKDFRVAFSVMFQWRRATGYNPGEMTFAHANGMYEACFGRKGVAEWIKKTFGLTFR